MTIASSPTITAAPAEWVAADWAALRAAGLAYVERFAHTLWTDYNEHDPGVTILELLCYAITDLSQRTSLDTKDLIRSSFDSDDAMRAAFPAAHRALPSSPVTLLDYRKLLIDIPGIRNAWLQPRAPRVYVQPPTAQNPNAPATLSFALGGSLSFDVQGFYDILLDLEDITNEQIEQEYNDWLQQYSLNNIVTAPLQDEDTPNVMSLGAGHPAIALMLDATAQPFGGSQGTVMILGRISLRARLAASLLEQARQTYLDNRNLGEDYLSVREVPTYELKLCADIELQPGAKVADVHARILLAADDYLTPSTKRYSLAELQALPNAKGLPRGMDEIFEGPLLKYGFILDEELAAAPLRSKIYSSDLIALIMAVPGVAAVRNLVMRSSGPHSPTTSSSTWSLPIPAGHRPQLVVEQSALRFFQGLLPVHNLATLAAAQTQFISLRRAAALQRGRTVPEIPVPVGTAHNLTTYRPLALDFPATYSIGAGAWPAELERRNQARQLQAYLLFFDQLLAGYVAQLSHVKDLLGTDATVINTYFDQVLDAEALPALRDLFVGDKLPGELPLSQAETDAAAAALALHQERRNRFLDHLLARFAENFNEYSLLLYSITGDRNEADIIKAKAALAGDLGNFHPARGINYRKLAWVGFQTSETPAEAAALYDNNVAGIVRRFARLVGMKSYRARFTDQEDPDSQDSESILLIDHALLLPVLNPGSQGGWTSGAWLPACVTPNGDYCDPLDPYSYRVTIVLPGYGPRFADIDYRRYCERVLRSELPAHVMARICWVSKDQLEGLQYIYGIWHAYKKAMFFPDRSPESLTAEELLIETTYIDYTRELIVSLNELHTVYPEGWLTYCSAESSGNNPILLNQTMLGQPAGPGHEPDPEPGTDPDPGPPKDW